MKKDKSIQIIRIISMMLIITCHIMGQSTIEFLKMSTQFFNVGVQIFLFISGYLYGKKEINDIKKFYKGRIIKVFCPVYIFIILLYIITFFVYKEVNIKYLFIYFFNLQYILGGMQGANHLWFITMIAICYLLTPILYKYKKILTNKKNAILTIIILLFISIMSSCVSDIIARMIIYFIVYLLGYLFR